MESTEERIRQSALRLFAQKGYEATSIRDIATEAEITSSSLYYYIGTKEDLLIKIMREGLTAITKNAIELVATLSKPEYQLAALVQLHVITHGVKQLETLVTDTEYRALKGENRVLVSKLRREYELIWRSILDNGQKEGVFHFDDLKLTTYALLEMCTGVAHWYSSQGPKKIEDIGAIFADMALTQVDARRDGKKIIVKELYLPNPMLFIETISIQR